jgi:hypothetical protein
MALRARSTDLASISSASEYKAMTMAASGHCPITKAPTTATLISALMLSWPRNRAESLLEHSQARQPNGQRCDGHAGQPPRHEVRGEEVDRFGCNGDRQGHQQSRHLRALSPRSVFSRWRRRQCLGLEAGLLDGGDHRLPGGCGRIDAQRSPRQVELQAADFGERLQRAANLPLFNRAIHLRNAQEQHTRRCRRLGSFASNAGAWQAPLLQQASSCATISPTSTGCGLTDTVGTAIPATSAGSVWKPRPLIAAMTAGQDVSGA